jgi:membrane-anchored protein YejM (alkaline phosphatase superfamily)
MSANGRQPATAAGLNAGSERTVLARALLLFVCANYALALALSYQYVAGGTALASVPAACFALLAFLAQIGTFVLAIALLLACLAAWRASRPLVRPFGALSFTVLAAFLFVDGRIYALFRFHTNSLVVNLVTTPGGLRSMELPPGQILAAIVGAAVLCGAQFWLFGRVARYCRAHPGPARRPGSAWALFVAFVLVAAVAERGVYLWASYRRMAEITRVTRLVPLYQPVLIRALDKASRLRPDAAAAVPAPGTGMLRYPLKPLTGRVSPEAPNVLWILLDGWRADQFNPETTPKMWEFSREAQVFPKHVSGGNATRFGVFSMFYGLHGTYWRPFLSEGRGPVLIDKFKEAGYRFKILSSTPLDYPEFKKTVFSAVLPDVDDTMPGQAAAERDAAMVGAFASFLEGTEPGRRFFSFLFFDTSHNPFLTPPAYQKFAKAASGFNYLAISQRDEMATLFSRYRNSVFYEDALVGEVLKQLADRKLLEKTIVVISADHGHEFYEHGYFGYNGAFTPEEIEVPLVLYVPGMAPRTHDYLTTGQDIPATVLKLAGVGDEPSTYSVGRDLFDAAARPYALACSFTTCGLRDDDGYLIFGIESEGLLRFESRDRGYKELDDPSAGIEARAAKLQLLLREMRSFLR